MKYLSIFASVLPLNWFTVDLLQVINDYLNHSNDSDLDLLALVVAHASLSRSHLKIYLTLDNSREHGNTSEILEKIASTNANIPATLAVMALVGYASRSIRLLHFLP